MDYEKVLVNTPETLTRLCADLELSELVAYDTETNAVHNLFGVQLVGMSFAVDEEACYYVPWGHYEGEQLLDPWAKIRPLMKEPGREFVCHNAKFDEMVVRKYDMMPVGKGHDTYIMNWLLSEEATGRGLKALVLKHFGYQMQTFDEVVDARKRKRGEKKDYNFARVHIDDAISYAADDAYWTLKLYKYFKAQLDAQNLWTPYDRIERPFNRVLGDIERMGVRIDLDAINYADERMPHIIEQVEAEIFEEAGEVFNIKAGAQLGRIVFEKMGIGNNVPKTKTGAYKTDKKTLELYATKNKIVENILRRKKIGKTHSTFVEGTKNFITEDGRIHAGFNGCGTVTGRLSSSKPNLQQIEGDEVEEIKVRNFFIPSEGRKFVVADYSQIELRIIAHFSRDENMTEAFMAGDEDFHDGVARRVFEVPEGTKVTRKQRVVAKTLNFGVGYGRGPVGIAEQLQITKGEAKQFIDDWFDRFPGVAAYRDYLIAKAQETGYIRTISGRKRRLPDINSRDWMLKGRAERQALNTKIQGSAADLIKAAMIALAPRLQEVGADMVIQVHDELVIDTPIDVCDDVTKIVKQTMENPINDKNPLRLPLVVEPVTVTQWGDAK